PIGGEGRRILFIKELASGSAGVALQRDGTIVEMWQKVPGNRDVVVDDLSLREACTRVQDLIGIRQSDVVLPDPQRLRARPRGRLATSLGAPHRWRPASDPHGRHGLSMGKA